MSASIGTRERSPAVTESSGRNSLSPTIDPPNGGFEAWLSVFAAFCIMMNSWGITAIFGAFRSFYKTDLLREHSDSSISWIGSIQCFLIVFIGVVVGPLYDRGYLRPIVLVGQFMVAFGMMMLSLCTKYYQVLLSQGLCIGIGGGLTFVPALAVVATQFTTKRPIAIGCASLGSGIAGIIWPIMFRRLQPRVGFGWAVRSIAFMNLALAIISCVILCRQPGKKNPPRRLVDTTAFRDPRFILYSASLFFVFVGYFIPLFYIPSYAMIKLGASPDLALYLLSITGGASIFGRTTPYMLGTRFKPIYIFIFWSLVGAVLIFSWIVIDNMPGFIVWVCVWGYLTGVLVTAPASIVAHPSLCPSLDIIGTRLGMSWCMASIGALIGAPVSSALGSLGNADFVHAQIFAGAFMAAGVGCLIWPLIGIIRYDRLVARDI